MRGFRSPRKGRGRTGVVAALLAVLLLPAGIAGSNATSPAPHASHGIPELPRVIPIHDGELAAHTLGALNSTLQDSIAVLPATAAVRSFFLNLSTPLVLPGVAIQVQTLAVANWAGSGTFPNGPDNLPRLSDWTWWVRTGSGANDSGNWTLDPDGAHLDRNSTWSDQTYQLFGVSSPTVTVAVEPAEPNGARAVGTGFVLNAPGYENSIPPGPGYLQVARGIHPALVRITLGIPGALSGWNTSTDQPIFNFQRFDREFQFVQELGAQVLLSFPAGTWGDGNTLPAGTPINASAPMSADGYSGSFPTPGAMYAIVRGVANHTAASSEAVEYWSIGNEVPLYSVNESIAFATVINAAIGALRPEYTAALVGADDMLDGTYLGEFAARTPAVGFLSFHWYPAGVCKTPHGAYCPPGGGNNGTTTPALFTHPAFESHYGLLPPDEGVAAWRNATGRTLPVVLSETNLAASGGIGTSSQAFGTDPRQQSLVGAAWLGSLLVDASTENLSAITYFGLTSATNFSDPVTYAYGGFGFGLTNQTADGSTTYYAPYWAMSLWGTYLPAGAPSVATTGSDPSAISAFGIRNGTQLNVALVSRVDVSVHVVVPAPAGYTLASTAILDARSYQEVYDPGTNATTILRSGVDRPSSAGSSGITLDGYGMAVLGFVVNGSQGAPASGSPSALGLSPAIVALLGIGVPAAVAVAAIALYRTRRSRPGGSGAGGSGRSQTPRER